MSTKGYPAPLTWDRLLELAAQGHDHYDAALTSTRARQLVASVREHFASQPEAPKGQEAGRWMVGEDGLARKQSFPITESLTRRTYDLERDLAAANARADAAERRVGITRALDRATKAEAERDQLAARVTELEEDKQMYDRSRVELYRQACTPEERAVLEAMSKARIGSDDCGGYFSSSTSSVVMAELANRAAKAKK
jgi:hypothetical protein